MEKFGRNGIFGVGKEKLGTNRSGSCTLSVKTVRAGLDLAERKGRMKEGFVWETRKIMQPKEV